MDLNRVAAFARVVHEGSFTAAAKALRLPKSSVSRSVAQLEEELGVRLLHRTTRKLHLTDAGTEFYDRVARALTDIDEATSAASDKQSQAVGSVRLTAPLDLGVWALAGIVARFVRKYPRIRVEVSLSSRAVDLVAEGFDLAVRAGPVRDESLVARNVGELRAAIFGSRKYLARRGEPRTLDELQQHDFVVFRPTAGKGTWTLVDESGRSETIAVKGPLAGDDMSFVKKSVLAGAGLAILPMFLAGREEESGKLVRVLDGWSVAGSALHIVYPSARYVPQRVIVLRDFLVKELGSTLVRCGEVEEVLSKRLAR